MALKKLQMIFNASRKQNPTEKYYKHDSLLNILMHCFKMYTGSYSKKYVLWSFSMLMAYCEAFAMLNVI